MFLKNLSNQYATNGGIKVPHRKSTALKKTVVMPDPEQLIFPVLQHIGVPCTPVVKKNDRVKVGDVIAKSDKPLSSPIHSSVSGTVSKIAKVLMPDGSKVDAIYVESDGQQELSPNVKPPKVGTKEELITAVKESGLVGLGGAGFPTHVKLNVPEDKKIDILLINAAECEPYITSDNRTAIEDTDDVMSGISLVKSVLNIEKAIIAIEDNKPRAIKILKDAILKLKKQDISLAVIKAKYPQGAEKVLIKSATGRVVPMGKLPMDAGCIVMNITTVAFLSKYVRTGMPLIEKRVTVAGSAIKKSQNVTAKIGTPIRDVINFCGAYKGKVSKILMGGPMMGLALVDDSLPILKQNNAILVLNEQDATLPKPTECIRCGRCVNVCPMGLMPVLLESYAESKNAEELEKLCIMNCMECGSCAYVCPAARPLVQSIRLGKKLLKK